MGWTADGAAGRAVDRTTMDDATGAVLTVEANGAAIRLIAGATGLLPVAGVDRNGAVTVVALE